MKWHRADVWTRNRHTIDLTKLLTPLLSVVIVDKMEGGEIQVYDILITPYSGV